MSTLNHLRVFMDICCKIKVPMNIGQTQKLYIIT